MSSSGVFLETFNVLCYQDQDPGFLYGRIWIRVLFADESGSGFFLEGQDLDPGHLHLDPHPYCNVRVSSL